MACVIDILCNTMSGIGAGFLTGGGGLLFQAYDIASFCEIEVRNFSFQHYYTIIIFVPNRTLIFSGISRMDWQVFVWPKNDASCTRM